MDVRFEGPAGVLEGILWEPKGKTPKAAVVVCHPHPKPPPPTLGGTMRNNVVHRIARGLLDADLAVLRFNFRGVGLSGGEHDGNGAEDGDLMAALDFLQARYPGLPLWASGFSFGARTTASTAIKDPRIQRVVLVALPVSYYPVEYAKDVMQPGLILMAGEDSFGTLAVLQERFPGLVARMDVQEVPGVDHFFTGALDEVRQRITDWASKSLQEA
jgi:alpha/beta superfamily hydrolase